MVFAVMNNFKNILFFIFISLMISSCHRHEQCDPQHLNLDLAGPYNGWFDNLPSTDNYSINILSSDSLTDAFQFEKYVGYCDEYPFNDFMHYDDPCIYYQFGNIQLSYFSSIYRFSARVMVLQMDDGPHLRIEDNSSSKYAYIFMDYNIITDTPNNIIYSIDGKQTSPYKISVEIVPTVISNNFEFHNVYKITDNLTLNEGNNFDITVFYIDTTDGLIKFEQKCGTIWDIIY
jgi:hypothetical protein